MMLSFFEGNMVYYFYLSVGAAALIFAILKVLKYITISKIRLDKRDERKKANMSTLDVLNFLKNHKPFPVSVHTGWKLQGLVNSARVWNHEASIDTQSAPFIIYAAFRKVRVPSQIILQTLKDVSKTSSWKPGCLATSITSRPGEEEPNVRGKGMMGNLPVQHDVVVEETMPAKQPGFWGSLFMKDGEIQTVKMEQKRYWHREDNGVCWHLQMCEARQHWLFFLAQPVQEVDECLLTVVGYHDSTDSFSTGRHVSEILGSLSDFIRYRKCVTTTLIDMKMPSTKHEKYARSYSSSEDHTAGQKMFLRFRSLVEKPIGAEKLYSMKQQLIRSSSILRHKSPSFTSGLDLPENGAQQEKKTCSLDRRKNMPNLSRYDQVKLNTQTGDLNRKPNDTNTVDNNAANKNSHSENNNVDKGETVVSANTNNKSDPSQSEDETGDDSEIKDLDRSLEADVDDQEKYEQDLPVKDKHEPSKEGIQHIVTANHTAAQLITVALQAANIDLRTSIQDQVLASGGWMFCGLDNDVVVLKKVSIKENIHCYLGKGVIQAKPQTVWNAIRNPRTKFTYDDSLKKVDVIEKVSDNIKIVYFYHEVLQLFKTECYDMVVTQSERVDKGDKYVLAMESTDSHAITSPQNTARVKVLPSGWIIEPVNKDKKVYSMVTYIMQIDQGNSPLGADRTPFEDFIAKQPLSIAYLRQYLKGCLYQK